MKTTQYINRLSLLATVLLGAVLAVPTSGLADDLKIHGWIDAFEDQFPIVPPVPPVAMVVELEGDGNASHLGYYTLQATTTVSLSTFFGEGEFQIATPSGAVLYGTVVGQGYPTPGSNLVSVEHEYTIEGGTGRFEGATGTLYYHRVLDRLTGISIGSVDGVVVLP